MEQIANDRDQLPKTSPSWSIANEIHGSTLIYTSCGSGLLHIQFPCYRICKCICRSPQSTDLDTEWNICHPSAEFLFCVCLFWFSKDLLFFWCTSLAFHALLRPSGLKFKTLVSHVNPSRQNRAATWMGKKTKPIFYQAVPSPPHSMQFRRRLEKANRMLCVFVLIGGTKLIKVISK